MADDADNHALLRRGRGRPRGVRVSQSTITTGLRATRGRGRGRGRASSDGPISRGRGRVGVDSPDRSLSPEMSVPGPENSFTMDLDSRPATPQTSRAPSPTPSLASVSSGIRRLGSLQPELPPPGRLASVRTAPTGHYFLPTSSKVTLRGTRRMTFVPTVPLSHKRPQPTITSDSIPDFFDNLHNDNSFGDNDGGLAPTRGRGLRGRGRFMPELVASGPFAYGSSSYQPLGVNSNGNEFGQPIVEEKKNRSDFAAGFESFRDDPWAPDMLYTYDNEGEDNTSSILEEGDSNSAGKEYSLYNGWTAKDEQPMRFDEMDERHILCLQLPISLPKFEQTKQLSSSTATKDVISERSKGKVTDKVKTATFVSEKIKGKEKEIDGNVDTARDDDSPEGKIGKLVIRRSGRIQMLIGDLVFDVTRGLSRSFLENAVVVDPDTSSVYNLGPIKNHLVVKPNISSLFGLG